MRPAAGRCARRRGADPQRPEQNRETARLAAARPWAPPGPAGPRRAAAGRGASAQAEVRDERRDRDSGAGGPGRVVVMLARLARGPISAPLSRVSLRSHVCAHALNTTAPADESSVRPDGYACRPDRPCGAERVVPPAALYMGWRFECCRLPPECDEPATSWPAARLSCTDVSSETPCDNICACAAQKPRFFILSRTFLTPLAVSSGLM